MASKKSAKKAVARKKAGAGKVSPKKKAATRRSAATRKAAPRKKATAKKSTAAKKVGSKQKAVAKKKATAKKTAPAKKLATPRTPKADKAAVARKPDTGEKKARGKISSMGVHLGHIFSLRPRANTSFRQADFRTARHLLQDEAYASIEEAARSVAEKALDLTLEGSSKRGFKPGR